MRDFSNTVWNRESFVLVIIWVVHLPLQILQVTAKLMWPILEIDTYFCLNKNARKMSPLLRSLAEYQQKI